ncbi:MAG: GNAT family N-acetyltransferase [Burkholderiaceae bacterium]
MSILLPITLAGEHATLEPLNQTHHDGLQHAVADGALWRLWYTAIPTPDVMRSEIARRLALQDSGSMLPFAIRRADNGALCGMTTYMNIDAANRRLEIGSTWYAASTQRTAINTECKLMLLTHAFETLECIAVEFRTHWMNHASRRAIARLGAKQDGVLRNHQRMSDGSLRDTVVFSIIASEWLTIKRHLLFKLGR